jgi:arylsulfatase A-like enzyme
VSRARWTAIVAGLALAALAVALGARRGEFALPARIRIENPVADLLATVRPEAVAEQPADDPVAVGGLTPGHALVVEASYRRALIVPPPSQVRFRTRVPPGARLRFGIAVAGPGRRDDAVAGVRFTVDVDGRTVFTHVLNPARRRADRRWLDADVPLPARDGEVEIALRTERDGDGPRLAGTPGWSELRVVRETGQDRQPASPAAPNVVVLLVDALRADQLGCYGATPSMTPTVDRLAAGGLVFDDMIAAASWTMPSVATYLTGLYPRSHGVRGSADAGAGALAGEREPDPTFLSDALVTLPELAQRAGITTVGVSANPLIARATNFTRGFETFVEGGWEREQNGWVDAARVNATFLRWLGRNRGHRFLAYLHYMEPHDPYTPSAAGRPTPPPGMPPDLAAGDVEPVSRKMRAGRHAPLPAAQVAHLRALYGLEVHDWDAALADLLAGLDAAGVRGSTVVVVVGDHGEEFQEHGQLKHRIHLYDELLHVPFIVAGPGVAPGRVREQVQGVDVFPTLAGLLGVWPPPGLPGQDLRAPHEPRPAFSETQGGILPDGRHAPLVSIRTDGWKLIEAPGLGHLELYDLVHDPGETVDRSDRAAEYTALRALLTAWEASTPPPPAVAGRDPAVDRKLRALGYVE